MSDGRDHRNHLLWQVLACARGEDCDAVALEAGDRRITFEDLARVTARGAREVDEVTRPGDRVLVAARDQLIASVSFLVALRSHATPVLLDASHPERVGAIADRWGLAAAIGGDDDAPPIAGAQLSANRVDSWLASPEGTTDPWRGLAAVAPQEPAFWTFTSGTTGEPKAIVHGHRGPMAACDSFGRWIGLRPGDRTISTAGVAFVYALGNNLLFPLRAGATAILPPDLRLPTVLDHLAGARATILIAGPGSLDAIARLGDRPRWRDALRGLRLVSSAGESLPKAVFERWRTTFGQGPVDNLGCSEMFNSFLSTDPRAPEAGTLGAVVPGYEIRIDGAAPRAGARGPLEVRGESRAVAVSLAGGQSFEESPAETFCATGDEIEVRPDGKLLYLGRIDDRFKVRGEFVQPLEIERQLSGASGVRELCVGPRASVDGLTEILIQVVLEDGVDPEQTLGALRPRVREALGTLFRASHIERAEALPRSDRGKLIRTRVSAASE